MKMLNPLRSVPPINYTDLRHLVAYTADQYEDKPLYEYNEAGVRKVVTYRGFADMVAAMTLTTARRVSSRSDQRVLILSIMVTESWEGSKGDDTSITSSERSPPSISR